jgi:CheY-like chemotaxis protein
MSHELRTPLNAILGYTQLLEHDVVLSEKQRKQIREIDSAGNMLLELVNQILDLARIEEGNLHVSLESIPLKNVLQECKSLIKPMANARHIMLDVIDDTPCHVMADHTRLKQVIVNLMSNAIKYNHENGSVTVRYSFPVDGRVCIEVKDTGYGIPRNKINHIFDPFFRLEEDSRKIEGTGIGLAISNKLTQMMKGTLSVQSELGQGSTFWVDLPCSPECPCVENTHLQQNEDEHQGKKQQTEKVSDKILVVEDNPSNLKLISSQLTTLGYKADLASNGKEALNMIIHNHYALVLTDCNMPIMDGYDLATEIRKKNIPVPVVALTADAFPESEEACMKAGMNDRIIKPVSLQKLNDTLQQWLNTQI